MNKFLDPSLNEDLRRAALSVLNRGEKPLTCFLSGSHAEGFAGPGSDYDLFVIAEASTEADTVFRREIRVALEELATSSEVTVIPIQHVRQLSQALMDIEEFFQGAFTPSQKKKELVEPADFLLAHRIATGIALTDESLLEAIQKSIPKERLAAAQYEYAIDLAYERLIDADKFCRRGDSDLSAYSARASLDLCFDAVSNAFGTTSPSIKWKLRYAKHAMSSCQCFYQAYMRLLCSYPSDPIGVPNFVSECSRYLQAALDVTVAKSVGIWEGDVNIGRLVGDESLSTAPQAVLKSAYAWLVRRGTQLLVTTRESSHQLTHDEARVWVSIDNKASTEEIIERLSGHLSGAHILKLLHMLRDLDLISLPVAKTNKARQEAVRLSLPESRTSSTADAQGRTASAAQGRTASAAQARTASAAQGRTASAAQGRTASAAQGRTASAAQGRTASAAQGHTASATDGDADPSSRS